MSDQDLRPCSKCGNRFPKDCMTAKRVQFTTMDKPFKTLKNRTTDWLCPTCRDEDPAWRQPAHRGAPSWKESAS